MQKDLAKLKQERRIMAAQQQTWAVTSALANNPHGLTLASVQRICAISCATAKVLLRTHAVELKGRYYPKPRVKE